MKPRLLLAEASQPDGTVLALHEHDGRHYLTVDGDQTAGPVTRVSEIELARIGTSPFRPVRQPRVWIAGLGLGTLVEAACEALPQKRGHFHVAEPSRELPKWLHEYLKSEAMGDKRVSLGTDLGPEGLKSDDGWHAILLHADTAPVLEAGKALFENRRWLGAAYDSLRNGGLLAIASSRPVPKIELKLRRAGFNVARHEIDAVPNARKPKHHFLWLARKGKSDD